MLLIKVATRYPFQNSRLFPDFRQLSRSFWKADFSHFFPSTIRNFAQIFMLVVLIFKETFQTINIRKGMFLNINCMQFMLRNVPVQILLAIDEK